MRGPPTSTDDDKPSIEWPIVPWTYGDVFAFDSKLFMTYHSMGTPWDIFSPVGVGLGGMMYGMGIFRPYPSALASMGTVGFGVGCVGMSLGLAKLYSVASKGEAATPPWTPVEIRNRADRINSNYRVRIFDLCAWSGMGLAAVGLAGVGGPVRLGLGLAPGVMGCVQGLTIGSSVGSAVAVGCIYNAYANGKSAKDEK